MASQKCLPTSLDGFRKELDPSCNKAERGCLYERAPAGARVVVLGSRTG
jgi:hypothetical protein